MKKQEVAIFDYDEIFSIFQKIEELKKSIIKKEYELHDKMLKEIDSGIQHPYLLRDILQNDQFDNYRGEARRELFFISMEIKNIFERFFPNSKNT